jgi:hypothetical protein
LFQARKQKRGITMGSDTSEQVMTLLTELAVLKKQNEEYEANPSEAEQGEHRLRQERQKQITDEIKSLAEEKKESNDAAPINRS